ncbi:MAG: (d)CMP kinase [Gammaproteobacteria bacterium]|nr:(d)CMP kinase [Gammaproteobacteria bacterium]
MTVSYAPSPSPAPAPVVAIDGPSGTGKGTLCAALAGETGWHLLDSGALYRLVALAAQRRGIALDDVDYVTAIAVALPVTFVPQRNNSSPVVLLSGEDVTDAIRTEAAGSAASEVAALGPVRAALLARQRDFRQAPGLIADGRDMGTVVFPDAQLKVFLTASPEVRAQRRHKQLMEKGISVNLPRLLEDIARRDARDAERSVSPLKPAVDAVVLDTTSLNKDAVHERVCAMMRERRLIP